MIRPLSICLGLALVACAAPEAQIEEVLDVGGLGEVRVLLEVLDDQGRAVAVTAVGDDGPRSVQTPFELPCADDECAIDISVGRGTLSFTLFVLGRDRCGTEAVLFTLPAEENPVQLGLFDLDRTVTFRTPNTELDDDEDGIPNAFEPAVCGRFDLADASGAPTTCLDPADACCAASPLVGRAAGFEPGFFLASTELTVGVVGRCVATGACPLAAGRPAFLRELSEAAFDAPTTTLDPDAADEACAFVGGRLPTDAEWLLAAGDDEVYPWGDAGALGGAGEVPGCQPEDTFSANYAAAGVACSDGPVAVGSFPGSHVNRGASSPIADMAGNVFEWTVEDDGGHRLRGGAFDSPLDFLRNSLSFRVPPGDGALIEELVETGTTGARCAFDEEPAPLLVEPACD